MMKRELILIFSLGILLGVSGCMGKKGVNEAALAQMERKYGEKFTYAGPYGDSMSGTRQFMASCASLDGLVLVEAENFRKGPVTYRDNYLAVRYRAETETFLRGCAEAEFGEAKVTYEVRPLALSEDLPANADLEQYLMEGGVPLSFIIEVKEGDFTAEDQVLHTAERIAGSGAQFYMTLMVMEKEDYGTMDRKELNSAISHGGFVHCAKVEELGEGIQMRWLEG